jgi:hypothetical protein
MGFTVDAFNLAQSRMLSDFNKALADAEALGRVRIVEDTSRIVTASPADATLATAITPVSVFCDLSGRLVRGPARF